MNKAEMKRTRSVFERVLFSLLIDRFEIILPVSAEGTDEIIRKFTHHNGILADPAAPADYLFFRLWSFGLWLHI